MATVQSSEVEGSIASLNERKILKLFVW